MCFVNLSMMDSVEVDSNPEFSDSKSLDSGVENNLDNIPSNEASVHVSDEESYLSDKENIPEVTSPCQWTLSIWFLLWNF